MLHAAKVCIPWGDGLQAVPGCARGDCARLGACLCCMPMSAAVRLPETGVETPVDARQAAIARGIALVNSGLGYREAGSRVGVNYSTLWRAHKQSEEELASFEADAEATKRINFKARMLAEMAVERMLKDIGTVHERYVASWAWTAAKLAGIADNDAPEGINPVVGELLHRLSNRRASIKAGVEVSLEAPDTPSLAPKTLEAGPVAPMSGGLEPAGENP